MRTRKTTATLCIFAGHEGSLETLDTLGNILTALFPVHELALAQVNNLRARHNCSRGSLRLDIVRNVSSRDRRRKAVNGWLQSFERANGSVLAVRDDSQSIRTTVNIRAGLVKSLNLVHECIVQLGQLRVLGRKLLKFLEGLFLLPIEIGELFRQITAFLDKLLDLRSIGLLEFVN